MTYHVHVYRTVALLEVDVEADSEEAAMAQALSAAQPRSTWDVGPGWKEPGCKVLAIIPRAT